MKKMTLERISYSIVIASLLVLAVVGGLAINRSVSANKTTALVAEREQIITAHITETTDLSLEGENFKEDPSPFPTETLAFKPNDQGKYLEMNTDYVGWLKIEGTAIDYPVVRGNDNEIYLNTDFFGTFNDAGSIFMDYRNLAQFNDTHTAIYGHNMKDGSMFRDLNRYKDLSFFKTNPTIRLQGLYDEKTYRIFSVYVESANDYVLDFEYNQQTYTEYLETIKKKSLHGSDLTFTGNERILTLITCSYEVDNGRTIVHAIEND